MDKYIHIPWQKRIKGLRIAIHYSMNRFAKVMGVTNRTLSDLEKGKTLPRMPTIRKLRVMEKAFSEQLEGWIRRGSHLDEWGPMEKVYERFGGDNFHYRMRRQYRYSYRPPSRPEDIEALGGIEMFPGNKNEERRKAGIARRKERRAQEKRQRDLEQGSGLEEHGGERAGRSNAEFGGEGVDGQNCALQSQA